MPDDAQEAARTRVFLSYSRKDEAFTRRVAEALAGRGYTPDYDQSARDPANVETGISAEDEWWQRLKDMIAAADVMVFIVSPDSAASPVCDEEIAYARALGKRIIPILRRPVDFSRAPPRLSALNVKIDFTDDGEPAFGVALDRLSAALDLDVAWHRESARLTLLAVRWENAGRPDDLLLTAADVRAVGTLLERRPAAAPEPSEVLVALRDASRAKLDAEAVRQRRIIGRAFVRPALQPLGEGLNDKALRAAAAGATLATDLDFGIVPELWAPAVKAIFSSRLTTKIGDYSSRASLYQFDKGRARAAFLTRKDTLRIVDLKNGEVIREIELERGILPLLALSFGTPNNTILAASSGLIHAWNFETGEVALQQPMDDMYISTAAFSPDARLVVLATNINIRADGRVTIWDTQMSKAISILPGDGAVVGKARFSADNAHVITLGDQCRVWNVANASQRGVLHHNGNRLHAFEFNSNSDRIVTVAGNDAGVWMIEDMRQASMLQGHSRPITSAAFSTDSNFIVTSSADGTGRIWDTVSGQQVGLLEGHAGAVAGASFSTDCSKVVTIGEDCTVRLWDSRSAKCFAVLRGHEHIRIHRVYGEFKGWTASFDADGSRVISAAKDDTIRVWDAYRSPAITPLQFTVARIVRQCFSGDGRSIVWTPQSGECLVRDLAAGLDGPALKGHIDPISSAAFHPEDELIVTASTDGTAKLWCSRTGRLIRSFVQGGPIANAIWSSDGSTIATTTRSGSTRVWKPTDGDFSIELGGSREAVTFPAFSADSSCIVMACSDDTVRVWSVTDGSVLHILRGHWEGRSNLGGGRMTAALFSFDDRFILSSSASDHSAIVWDASRGQSKHHLSADQGPVICAMFCLGGNRILTVSRDNANIGRLWSLETGKQIARLEGHTEELSGADVSRDGRRIATASKDGTIRLWDAGSAAEMGTLCDERYKGGLVAFSPDGRWLVARLSDGGAKVWDVSRTGAVARDRAILITAALARGVGLPTDAERTDVLMQDAPEDLYAEALKQLGRRSEGYQLDEVAETLRAPLHPNCYLSPTKLEEEYCPPSSAPAATMDAGEAVNDDTAGEPQREGTLRPTVQNAVGIAKKRSWIDWLGFTCALALLAFAGLSAIEIALALV